MFTDSHFLFGIGFCSTDGGPMIPAPTVHFPNLWVVKMSGNWKGLGQSQGPRNPLNLPVAMMRETQKDQGRNQGQRNQRKIKSIGQEPSTRAVIARTMVHCHSPDSLAL